MSRPKFRGEPSYYDSLGSQQVTSTLAALNTTGVTLIAAPGAAKRLLIKAYSISGASNGTGSAVFLGDGTDVLPIATATASNTVSSPGWVTIPSNGIKFATNTAVSVKASVNAAMTAYIAVKYDTVDNTGSDG